MGIHYLNLSVKNTTLVPKAIYCHYERCPPTAPREHTNPQILGQICIDIMHLYHTQRPSFLEAHTDQVMSLEPNTQVGKLHSLVQFDRNTRYQYSEACLYWLLISRWNLRSYRMLADMEKK